LLVGQVGRIWLPAHSRRNYPTSLPASRAVSKHTLTGM
jgi:hypothetical protein